MGVPSTPDGFPQDYSYDADTATLHVGAGEFAPVAADVWDFHVSGMSIIYSWLAYRTGSGAGRSSSDLDQIRPERWTATMTEELLELIWVLEHTVAARGDLDNLLDAVLAGEVIAIDELPEPTDSEREPPPPPDESGQSTFDLG